jgi:DNA-binding transcriptional MerR regulator
MTIQELARRANVTPRTIRYYVEQGILPPPGRGRPSEYTDEHLKVLDLVRRLKDQYLPLEEIRSMLQSLSVEQLEDFLSQTAPQPEPARDETNSAAEYISQILNRGAMRSRLQQEATLAEPPAPPAGSPPPYPAFPSPAPAPVPAPARAPLPYSAAFESVPASPSAPQAAAEPEQVPEPSESQKQAKKTESEETWQRVKLAPDIEMHYRPPQNHRQEALLKRAIEAVRRIVGHEDVPEE